jgi:hypothetical protein
VSPEKWTGRKDSTLKAEEGETTDGNSSKNNRKPFNLDASG